MSKTVDEIIKDETAKGTKQGAIAKILNKAGLTTKRGLKWSQSTVSTYALKELGIRRNETYKKNSARPKPKQRAPRADDLESAVLEILTTKLSSELKMKIINQLTGKR